VSTATLDGPVPNTQHGLLVAFGEFLSQNGLLAALLHVPIRQRTRTFHPQVKLIEFLAGIMSGIEYLTDLNAGPHPLVGDPVVAQAWDVPGFAHASGVSQTLAACDAATETAVEAAITAFSRPFIEAEVNTLLRGGKDMVYDLDLTGQAVSSTSQAYPDVAFGWMNDQVRLGYQVAQVCLTTASGERLWLAGFHHRGNMVSSKCLTELLGAAEAQTQVRPHRRVELVQQRVTAGETRLAGLQLLVQQQDERLAHLKTTHLACLVELYQVEHAEALPKSPEKQAVWERRHARTQQRLARIEAQLTHAQAVRHNHQTHCEAQQQQLTTLRTWHAQLEADNRTNPNPPPRVWARTDAGFTSGEHLTWLLEMGYSPETKAPNGQTTAALRAQVPTDAVWTRVGDNAEMLAIGTFHLHGCPFPLTAALERFKVKDAFHYATLIRYADDARGIPLAAWFAHYNARQIIEAGNKELKRTFQVQHLMSHSLIGIRLQVRFAGLATNAIRWCRPWLRSCVALPTAPLTRALNSTKQMVRVAANSAAQVQQTSAGMTVQFAPTSALHGSALCLRGVAAIQMPLALHKPADFASP
jgi:hypothetical protein